MDRELEEKLKKLVKFFPILPLTALSLVILNLILNLI